MRSDAGKRLSQLRRLSERARREALYRALQRRQRSLMDWKRQRARERSRQARQIAAALVSHIFATSAPPQERGPLQ